MKKLIAIALAATTLSLGSGSSALAQMPVIDPPANTTTAAGPLQEKGEEFCREVRRLQTRLLILRIRMNLAYIATATPWAAMTALHRDFADANLATAEANIGEQARFCRQHYPRAAATEVVVTSSDTSAK